MKKIKLSYLHWIAHLGIVNSTFKQVFATILHQTMNIETYEELSSQGISIQV